MPSQRSILERKNRRARPYWSAAVAFCSHSTPQEYLSYLNGLGIDYIVAGDYRVDLAAALSELNETYDVETVRVDSGGTLNGVLLRECLVDEVSVILDPLLVGGESPRSFFRAEDLGSPEGAVSLRLKHFERLDGDTVWLRYEVVRLE